MTPPRPARVALATCRAHAALDPDDQPLLAALAARGVSAEPRTWDDPAVAWERHDAVVIRSVWDYVPRRDDFVAWARAVGAVTRLHNSEALVAWNTDKRYLRALARAGVPVVPTLWLDRGQPAALAPLVAARGWGDLVVKPVVSAGAHETIRVPAAAPELAAAHLARLQPVADMMVQPYLPAIEGQGELSLVFFAGAFSHAVRKRPRAGDFRSQPHFGAAVVAAVPDPAELVCARAALAAAPAPTLYARVDLVSGRDGEPLVMELELVEPRLFFREGGPAAVARAADAIAAAVALPRQAAT
jgi:glutathione synthase/RimK-type ligase-like ATP-grasp enzyme